MPTFNGIPCKIIFEIIRPKKAEQVAGSQGLWENQVLGEWSGKAVFSNKNYFDTAKKTNQDNVKIDGHGANFEIYGFAISTIINDDQLTINFKGNGKPLTANGASFVN